MMTCITFLSLHTSFIGFTIIFLQLLHGHFLKFRSYFIDQTPPAHFMSYNNDDFSFNMYTTAAPPGQPGHDIIVLGNKDIENVDFQCQNSVV